MDVYGGGWGNGYSLITCSVSQAIKIVALRSHQWLSHKQQSSFSTHSFHITECTVTIMLCCLKSVSDPHSTVWWLGYHCNYDLVCTGRTYNWFSGGSLWCCPHRIPSDSSHHRVEIKTERLRLVKGH